ncbi:MAG TPA: helix-turn-helix transcriptional regulator [Oculatellaceae cyanobacterium]
MSKNVFADLGFDETEAAALQAKAFLFMQLQDVLEKSQKNQLELAKMIGIDQPKVSKIMSGKMDEFSLDRIMLFLQKMGIDIHIGVTPAPKNREAKVVIERDLVSA